MKRLFDGKSPRLCLDQYGTRVYATTVKELCASVGRSKASKMYVDRKDGSTMHVGYVVGQQWFSIFQRCEVIV